MNVTLNYKITNSLGLAAKAKYGALARSTEEVAQALAYAAHRKLKFIPLGAGSNIVPAQSVNAFVCEIAIPGIELLRETSSQVWINVAAGQNWHELVLHCLNEGWFGLENLALIPGRVGAAPVQNIGAYGVELSSHLESVQAINRHGERVELSHDDCEFNYRSSVFKRRDDFTIVSTTLCLSKTPELVVDYPDVRTKLDDLQISDPTPHDVARAVIDVRSAKLPDPAKTPNAGSFFKNPIVTQDVSQQHLEEHPTIKVFPVDSKPPVNASDHKLSAAQLIDLCGWKSKAVDRVECWHTQPLVLVNRGGASGNDILKFASAIKEDVFNKFGVHLEIEPTVLV